MSRLSLNLAKSGSQASSILDYIRFFAAFVVFLFHFYVPLPGYQAVMVFFVLSGYFISSTVLKSVNEKSWSWSDYLLKRITRLWVVLIPCLLLTYAWGKVQLSFFGYYKLGDYLNWETFFGNLFFLQQILVKPYGMNGPLWSLSYEFWYYILFPCIVLMISSSKRSTKVLYAVVIIAISVFVGERIMLFFLVWMMGAVIPILKPLKIKNSLLKVGLLAASAILVILSTRYENSWDTFLLDARVGLAFALFMYLIISFFNDKKNEINFDLSKPLAGFSYTLYLVHYPLAHFIFTWMESPSWPFQETPIGIKMLLTFAILLYAWVIGLLTEKHTDKVRRFLQRNLFDVKQKSERINF